MNMRSSSFISLAVPLFAVLAHAGCGSSATTMTSPTTVTRCSVAVNGKGEVPAQGGTGSLAVSAARECAWSASVEGQWLSIKAGASGQGDGAVEFAAVPNPDPAVRRGAVVLNEQRVEVMQAAGECAFSLAASAASFPHDGGSGQVDVRASSGLCTWSAESDSPWIVLRPGATGRGSSAVGFDVAPGNGVARTGTVKTAGHQFTVTQSAPVAGPAPTPGPTPTPPPAPTPTPPTPAPTPTPIPAPAPCAFAVSPEHHAGNAAGGTMTVNVTSSAGCAWTAASNVAWLSVRSAGPESGSGTVQVTVTPNTGAARVGTATIAGRTVTVNQAAPAVPTCAFKVSPLQFRVKDEGKLVKVDVESSSGCTWSAVSNASWIRVIGGAAGSGNGDVWLGVQENEGAERSGTVTIAGHTVTVNQRED